jgi:hypothetical protein
MISNNCSMNEHILVFIVIAVDEAIVMTAQTILPNSDKQKSIVNWLETNDPKTIDAPMIMA